MVFRRCLKGSHEQINKSEGDAVGLPFFHSCSFQCFTCIGSSICLLVTSVQYMEYLVSHIHMPSYESHMNLSTNLESTGVDVNVPRIFLHFEVCIS